MNEARGGFVHVVEGSKRAVPFADEDAFIAFVAVRGDHGDEDIAARQCNV